MKKAAIKSIIGIILAGSMILLTAACSAKPESDSDSKNSTASQGDVSASQTDYQYGKIQIPGKDGALCGAPIYIAYDKGFFAEEGFDVELISADAETRKIGLNNGTIPIVNGDFQFFPSVEEGVNVSVVDGLHNGCIKFLVRNDSDIKEAKDLKGKKIGVDEIGGTPHQVASVWVENAGISALPDKHEVEFVPYSDGNLELEALQKGDIDVAALWDPFGSVAEKEGKAKIIFDLSTDEVFAGKYCCFLYASNKVLEENPDEVAALLRAYRKAQDWISKNPEEAVDIIINGKYSAIEDRELAIELVKSYEYPSAENRANGKQKVDEDVKYFAQALHDIGYLKSDAQEFTDKIYKEVDVNS